MDMAAQFPQRLRAMRERRRITRKTLGELCGLTYSAIRRYERGESEPTLSSLVALSDYFECTIDDLVGRKKY